MAEQMPNDKNPIDSGPINAGGISSSDSSQDSFKKSEDKSVNKSDKLEDELLREELYKALGSASKIQPEQRQPISDISEKKPVSPQPPSVPQSFQKPVEPQNPDLESSFPKEEKKPFVPPQPFSSPLEKDFRPSPSIPVSPNQGREFPREREIVRERESVPSKREKEFISREEAETSKEIIRTFQKDLLRREAEVKRENKIPEKEVIGFSPPKPPEEGEKTNLPEAGAPSIPIPKISLKFAIIIVGAVVLLSGFYLIYQFKPCIPPFCKKGGPTPVPTLPVCDKNALKNICQSPLEPFPQCDTEKLCLELNVSQCERAKICDALAPVATCQPVELIPPLSLLPYIPEEEMEISQKSRSEIIDSISSIAQKNYQRPALIRILIKYSPDKCNRAWLSLKDFFDLFGLNVPADIISNLKENYTLVLYLPGEEEKNLCLAANDESSSCYGPRLAIVFSAIDQNAIKQNILNWEPTFLENFKPFILNSAIKEEIGVFQDFSYKNIPIRYKNLPSSTTALNYGVYKNLVIIGTSKNSLLKVIDLILSKEEEEQQIFEGASPSPAAF